MEVELKCGDIVQLKSGGLKMTVTMVLEGIVHSAWFAGSNKESGAFTFEAVMAYQEVKRS